MIESTFTTIDEYILQYSPEIQTALNTLRTTILKAAPKAKSTPKPLNDQTYRFEAEIKKVHATFDGEPYDGSLVRMQTPCHIIGIKKDIREKIAKQPGDTIEVTIRERR